MVELRRRAPVKALRWVLLPGLDGTGLLFRDFLRFVPDPHAIVVRYPDEPSWTLDDHAHHVQRQLPPDSDCIVVAESFSGPVAMLLLPRAPAIRGLVLVASFMRCPHPLLRLVPIGVVVRLGKWGLTPRMLRVFCLGRDASDAALDALKRVAESMPPAVLGSRLSLLRSLGERFHRADVPRLLLRARHDRLVLDPLAADEDDRMSSMATIDGPHFLLQARAAECWRVIEAWLAAAVVQRN